ncbi:MAG: general secretion pathway protein GspK [Candidatus Omnitrophica bacterium]|nr:general secretion pathway protein GspK [Candidatus Omnitrophota bacterium]
MNTIRPFLCRLRGNEGSILVITFWALSFLSFFAVTIGFMARQKMALAEKLDQRAKLRLVAAAGAQKGLLELKKPDLDPNVDSFKEPWAQSSGLVDAGAGDPFFKVTIIDEERKININTAGPDVLNRFFKIVLDCSDSDAESLSSAIIDWRDEDSIVLAQGAEDSYYEGLKYPYECKDAKFDIIDELLLVRGITATIYRDIKDHVTPYGSGAVNVNTASRVVLLSLGLNEKLADKILAFRNGEDALEGTEDDRYFSNVAGIASELGRDVKLEQEDSVEMLSNLVAGGFIGVTSSNFMITSRAGYEYKKGAVRIECIFERIQTESVSGYSGKLKYWRIDHENQ